MTYINGAKYVAASHVPNARLGVSVCQDDPQNRRTPWNTWPLAHPRLRDPRQTVACTALSVRWIVKNQMTPFYCTKLYLNYYIWISFLLLSTWNIRSKHKWKHKLTAIYIYVSLIWITIYYAIPTQYIYNVWFSLIFCFHTKCNLYHFIYGNHYFSIIKWTLRSKDYEGGWCVSSALYQRQVVRHGRLVTSKRKNRIFATFVRGLRFIVSDTLFNE